MSNNDKKRKAAEEHNKIYAEQGAAAAWNHARGNNVNVGTIGHVDRSKSTLTSALMRVCREVWGQHEQ